MKFLSDNSLNYLVQKINSIFRIDSYNKIRHDDLEIRKLDADKIKIKHINNRLIETDETTIKLGTIKTVNNTNTSILKIDNNEVFIKNNLTSENIKTRWISQNPNDGGDLTLSGIAKSAVLPQQKHSHIKIGQNKIMLSNNNYKQSCYGNSANMILDNNYFRLIAGTSHLYTNLHFHNDISTSSSDELAINFEKNSDYSGYYGVYKLSLAFKMYNDIGIYSSNMNGTIDTGKNSYGQYHNPMIKISTIGNVSIVGRNDIQCFLSKSGADNYKKVFEVHSGAGYEYWARLYLPNNNNDNYCILKAYHNPIYSENIVNFGCNIDSTTNGSCMVFKERYCCINLYKYDYSSKNVNTLTIFEAEYTDDGSDDQYIKLGTRQLAKYHNDSWGPMITMYYGLGDIPDKNFKIEGSPTQYINITPTNISITTNELLYNNKEVATIDQISSLQSQIDTLINQLNNLSN